jgi:hypothetical protein
LGEKLRLGSGGRGGNEASCLIGEKGDEKNRLGDFGGRTSGITESVVANMLSGLKGRWRYLSVFVVNGVKSGCLKSVIWVKVTVQRSLCL